MVEGGMDADVIAYLVAFGELDGGKFDFDSMEWEKKD